MHLLFYLFMILCIRFTTHSGKITAFIRPYLVHRLSFVLFHILYDDTWVLFTPFHHICNFILPKKISVPHLFWFPNFHYYNALLSHTYCLLPPSISIPDIFAVLVFIAFSNRKYFGSLIGPFLTDVF